MRDDDFVREMNEFYNCARIFKPMTGFMASRFTSAKITAGSQGNDGNAGKDLLSKPEPKLRDAAEEAAKMGMFGTMTRSEEDFYPTRLLCKRFNVKAPAHSQPDGESESGAKAKVDPGMSFERSVVSTQTASPAPTGEAAGLAVRAAIEAPPPAPQPGAVETKLEVNPDENEAVEGKTAHAEVLRAIFGDSDSE
jgi:G patch domain-containing protein 1